MLFRAPTLLVVALFTGHALAAACTPGQYRDNQGVCRTCPNGSISQGSPNGQPPYQCTPCAAGEESNGGHTQCVKCGPGEYNDTPGTMCKNCPSGYFNKNVQGAKRCCICCAGFYSNSQRTNCNSCPDSRPFSYAGSNENSDCVNATNRGNRPAPATSCDMTADNVCPNPNGGGPVGSPINTKKRGLQCTKGFQSCPHYSGRGGVECVDTQSDPESCGGCVSMDGKGSGTDCTALEGVSVTRCAKGSCVIDACKKGYAKSLDGSSCVLTTTLNSESGKRAIRGRVF